MRKLWFPMLALMVLTCAAISVMSYDNMVLESGTKKLQATATGSANLALNDSSTVLKGFEGVTTIRGWIFLWGPTRSDTGLGLKDTAWMTLVTRHAKGRWEKTLDSVKCDGLPCSLYVAHIGNFGAASTPVGDTLLKDQYAIYVRLADSANLTSGSKVEWPLNYKLTGLRK